jgi:hypothetical protein
VGGWAAQEPVSGEQVAAAVRDGWRSRVEELVDGGLLSRLAWQHAMAKDLACAKLLPLDLQIIMLYSFQALVDRIM